VVRAVGAGGGPAGPPHGPAAALRSGARVALPMHELAELAALGAGLSEPALQHLGLRVEGSLQALTWGAGRHGRGRSVLSVRRWTERAAVKFD